MPHKKTRSHSAIVFQTFAVRKVTCVRMGRVLLRDVDFTLHSGQGLCVVGRNGRGKTSLLRILAGLSLPYEGELLWDNQTVDSTTQRRYVHYIGHQNALKPEMTPFEILSFWARLSKKNATERTHLALSAFDIAVLHDVPCRILSAGQQRRVALARLLLDYRPLWLLDEPTSFLDQYGYALLKTVIQNHQKHHGMIIFSSHTTTTLTNFPLFDLESFASFDILEWL